MLTLFMAISGGISWEDAMIPLRNASELACAFLILYIVIAVFAVLNAGASVAAADRAVCIAEGLGASQKHLDCFSGSTLHMLYAGIVTFCCSTFFVVEAQRLF